MKNNKYPNTYLSKSASADELEIGLGQMVGAGCRSVIVYYASASTPNIAQLNSILRQSEIPVFGGVFPKALFDGQVIEEAILLIGLPLSLQVTVVESMSNQTRRYEQLNGASSLNNLRQHRNFLLILDGLSPANEMFIDDVYETMGSGNNYIGGGAGYLDFQQRECIISNKGIMKDAAIIVGLPWMLNLSMSHGWEILSGPYLATETNGCKIKTINYQPALSVYKEALRAQGTSQALEKDFFSAAAHHPFGLPGIDNEIIVRDPIATDGDCIVCVGEVLPNSNIYVLQGNKETLINSVKAALAAPQYEHCAMVFNCISRALFLGDEIIEELELIKSELSNHTTSFGAFSLGEIITGRSGAINWLNKSTSIARFSLD